MGERVSSPRGGFDAKLSSSAIYFGFLQESVVCKRVWFVLTRKS